MVGHGPNSAFKTHSSATAAGTTVSPYPANHIQKYLAEVPERQELVLKPPIHTPDPPPKKK